MAIEEMKTPNSNNWIPKVDIGPIPIPFKPKSNMVGKVTHAKLVANSDAIS